MNLRADEVGEIRTAGSVTVCGGVGYGDWVWGPGTGTGYWD